PETEELVQWVLQLANRHTALKVLDIGTGSGCIAISLKKHLVNPDVSALDISSKALAVAHQNAISNGVDILFFEHDILKDTVLASSPYDIIISNPPYITLKEKEEMHKNVLAHEPHIALFVSNEKPLVFYEAIADFSLKNLKEGGLLLFEINEYLGKEMIQLLTNKGFTNIVLKKDLQGKDRMIYGVKT
ncbi:MAG: N5-glutamine methyltransferase family protein, partial [Bacteroidia bacterium]